MTFEVSLLPAIVAGVFAMVPGSIIYMPSVLGKLWMKEVGIAPKDMQGANAGKEMIYTLLTSIVTAIVLSVVIHAFNADTVAESMLVALLASWFAIGASLLTVFFERKSWRLFGITALNTAITYLVIGFVLGLFA
jgi:hypothetical protein